MTKLIELINVQGVVERVTLRSITVRGLDGEVMHVPNSEVKATVPSDAAEKSYDFLGIRPTSMLL